MCPFILLLSPHVKGASFNKSFCSHTLPRQKLPVHLGWGNGGGGWLLFLESTRGPCYEKRYLSRNTGPVTSTRKLGWWHNCPKYLGQTDRSWEEQAHPETSVLGEDSSVWFCWSSTVGCFWWSSANVAMVCVVVPWNQKHNTHALKDGENRMDQLSLCCLVRGKHLSGGSALGTNVKMPFSLRVMANIVWKSVGGTQSTFFWKSVCLLKPWSMQLHSRSILSSPCHLTDLWGIQTQMMSHLPGDTKELVWVHHPVSTQCTDCVQPWTGEWQPSVQS